MKTITFFAVMAGGLALATGVAVAESNGLGGLVNEYVEEAQTYGIPFGAAVSAASRITDSGMANGDEEGLEECGNGCEDPGVGNTDRYSTTNNGNESGTPRGRN